MHTRTVSLQLGTTGVTSELPDCVTSFLDYPTDCAALDRGFNNEPPVDGFFENRPRTGRDFSACFAFLSISRWLEPSQERYTIFQLPTRSFLFYSIRAVTARWGFYRTPVHAAIPPSQQDESDGR